MRGMAQRQKEGILARDNYSFRKHKKELAKKKKKEAKAQRKLDKKNIQLKESETQVPNENSEQILSDGPEGGTPGL